MGEDRRLPARNTSTIFRLGRRRGHSAGRKKKAASDLNPVGSAPRTRYGRLVSERTTQMSYEAALGAASGAIPRLSALGHAGTAVHHEAHRLGDSTVAVHDVRSVFLPAGPKMAGSTLPAMVNLLDADGAVSPARAAAKRRSRVSGLTWCRRWRSPHRGTGSTSKASGAATPG